jgi:hypothetical protein
MVGPRAQRRPFHRLGQIRHLTPQGIRNNAACNTLRGSGPRYHCRIASYLNRAIIFDVGADLRELDESICQSLKLELMEDRTALTGLK